MPSEATPEQCVKALVKAGISLPSLFHTVGPTCLSVDEIFQAFEYHEFLKCYTEEKKKYDKQELKQKDIEDKAKALLSNNTQ